MWNSCVLALAMAMGSLTAVADLPLQDSPSTGGSAQNPVPSAPESAPAEGGKKDTSNEAAKPPEAPNPEAKNAGDAKAEGTGKAKTSPGPRVKRRKTQPEARAEEAEPRKVVVRHGGAREPTAQIVPGMSREEAMQQRVNTEEMLASAEGNLRTLGSRVLDPSQQDALTQIRNYMEKAQSALRDGDVRRAHTLALKAQWLADDLMKH